MTKTNALTKLQLEAIRKRAEAATDGVWWKSEGTYVVNNVTGGIYEWDADYVAEAEREEDAEFIAHAREDIPMLLADIERMRKTAESAKSEISYALYSNKSEDVKRFYLENAIRIIERGIGGDSE